MHINHTLFITTHINRLKEQQSSTRGFTRGLGKLNHRTIHLLALKDETNTYPYKTDRKFTDYEGMFRAKAYGLQPFVKELAARGFTYLDSGAGLGLALDTLLTSTPAVTKCTGISMHYFNTTQKYLEVHKERLDWYAERAEDVLPHLNERYDLITDVFGSYFYSPNRLTLINEYHTHLNLGGRAYILLSSDHMFNFVHIGTERKRLEEYLAELYPHTFQYVQGSYDAYLVLSKHDNAPLSLHFQCTKIEYASWEHVDSESKDSTYPIQIDYEVMPAD